MEKKVKFLLLMLVFFVFIITACSQKKNDDFMVQKSNENIYNIKVINIDGAEQTLSQYEGKIILIVNVASQCGHTPQYKGLQSLYETYQDSGLVVLGFPANNFGQQEPGTNVEIKEFCSANFHVTFPMFSKISVKGEDIHPLYKLLTEPESNPKFAGEITWNFNKFLIDKQGNITARFESGDQPESEKVVNTIMQLL